MKRNNTKFFSYIPRLITLLIILTGASNSYAADFVKKVDFPVMSTRHYSFMDTICNYISKTNIHEVQRTGIFYDDYYKGSITDFIFSLLFYEYDEDNGRYVRPENSLRGNFELQLNGSYRLEVSAYLFLDGSGNYIPDGYLFENKGLLFFSHKFLNGYFIKQQRTKELECFLNFGYGLIWTFNIDNGKVTKAYAFFSESEIAHEAIDLMTGQIVPYKDYESVFYEK